MKTQIKVTKEVDIKTVFVKAGVRYWEDAKVNGVEDQEGTLIPFRVGDYWQPIIDIEAGKIIGWPHGTEADIHYKICDDGSYYLRDENDQVVLSIEGDYVPNSLIPGEYGDYIIMKVDGSGKILNWPRKISFEDFFNDED